MDALIETSLEPRKEWATPELKKVDIAIITAIAPFPGDDSQSGGPGGSEEGSRTSLCGFSFFAIGERAIVPALNS